MKALEVSHLSVSYGKDVEALRDVSLSVDDGQFCGIVGPNGGGKTTLLKAVLSLVPIASGTISIYGKPRKEALSLLSYVPQYATMSRSFPVTVEEVVAMGLHGKQLSPFRKISLSEAKPFLEAVGIEELGKRLVSELSGGQFQRMLIARALAVKPKLLLLDEPTASVDAVSRERIKQLLSTLNKQGMTIVLVTHDIHGIHALVDKVVRIDGTVVEVHDDGAF